MVTLTLKIEGQVSAATKLYQEKKEEAVNQANKQAHQLLDITEALVDKILPPEMEFEYQEVGEDSEPKAAKSEEPLSSRATAIGFGVPKRLKAVAMSKIRTLDMKNATQIEARLSFSVKLTIQVSCLRDRLDSICR